MTGIADVYLFLRSPSSSNARARLFNKIFKGKYDKQRFVVLSWKRTGSNLLCGILYNHSQITMHNELFNNIDIFTYYPESLALSDEEGKRWNWLTRDLHPSCFLEHIWSGKYYDGTNIRENSIAVGFKSFPEHWTDSNNVSEWTKLIMNDPNVKKIVLSRDSELAVYVSMIRAELSGSYMTLPYPKHLRVHVDPAAFQAFINNYRHTFQKKYKSASPKEDTFRITYEQLFDKDKFEKGIFPLLCRFIGVNETEPVNYLSDVAKQSEKDEDLSKVISNFDDLEYCFRYTDITMPKNGRQSKEEMKAKREAGEDHVAEMGTWSILLPICSRPASAIRKTAQRGSPKLNINRFAELESSTLYSIDNTCEPSVCWDRLNQFTSSFFRTTTQCERSRTEFIIGIDKDDPVFGSALARSRIKDMMKINTIFITIEPIQYGKICRIWNKLAARAKNDFIVLLGDDSLLETANWQSEVEHMFKKLSIRSGLPFGAACVAMNDATFEDFPTFPVLHRWHMNNFKRLLPRQFVNQGGDPFLYQLYARWNASCFAQNARLSNTVGGDSNARYQKVAINWTAIVLRTSITAMQGFLNGKKPDGICIDVVVPSYRCNNCNILSRIVNLRASIHIYITFWIIVDNTDVAHLCEVEEMARRTNKLQGDGNYVVRVVSYGENRGASYARNVGYNYSTADWVIFLDDDVLHQEQLLDAYVGSIRRYPNAKVMVGYTRLPAPCSLWTRMLQASNVMFFYGIAERQTHPPWGVTANLMVRGSRYNQTVQFKEKYPKTGGGEDIDFVFQMKEYYKDIRCVVSVPGGQSSASVVEWRKVQLFSSLWLGIGRFTLHNRMACKNISCLSQLVGTYYSLLCAFRVYKKESSTFVPSFRHSNYY